MISCINFLMIILLLLWRIQSVLGLTVNVDADDTQMCVGKNITLTCAINPFSTPPSASWIRNGTSLTTCIPTGICSTDSLSINGIQYSFSGTSTGIHVAFQIQLVENGIQWNCDHNAIMYPFAVNVLGTCKATTNSLETVDIVGIVLGIVAIVCLIAGTVFALYLNGLFCFAACRQRERQQPGPRERPRPVSGPRDRLQPSPRDRLQPIIRKEAIAGSDVKLLPELSRTQTIRSFEWTHDGNFVITGNALMQQDGTIHWVSPNDSGLWHCKLIFNDANEHNFDIQLNVTVHQYEADEGKRVQLLHYIKKSQDFQKVKWFHKGSEISKNNLKYQGGTVEVPALYVSQLAKEDTGEYTCKIQFHSITLELPVKLVVNGVGNSSLPPTRTPGRNTETS